MSWVEYHKKHRTHEVRVPLVVVVACVISLIVLVIFSWSAARGRVTHLMVRNPGELNVMIPSIVGLTQSSLDEGNSVRLTENGDEFFPLLLADIGSARESVHIESYIWWTGPICTQIATALTDAAKRGVEVRLLVDASGGHKMDDKLEKMMTGAGCQVRHFHPIRLSNLAKLNNRDHRKIAVIDGRVGFIGGYGIAKEWTGHAQDKEHWRDTGLRVQGPAVNRLQGAFCENWVEETGEIPAGEKYFPKLQPAGNIKTQVVYTSPTGSVSSVQVLYYLAIKSARHEIIIQNPYMLPDENAIKAMLEAVKRGVDVKIMVPATTSTDSPIVQHASHHHFGDMLKGGIKIWEYRKTLLHQKVIMVDGTWSCVGSTNFDDRSFARNDEISMVVLDPVIAAQLKQNFENDLRFADQRHFEDWKHRPFWHKVIDGLAYSGNSQL